jgi:hypothetical protein
MPKKKPTMSHTPEQRKAWHKGAGKGYSDYIANLRSGNFRGKFTHPAAKRSISYKPLPNQG